jgi:NAD(P)-dependent dehydrogenase (short-subunit alcohol dehydrogenase family)
VSRVFITGSADGLGRIAARQLVDGGHEVVLHARSESRGRDATAAVPGAAGVLTGDLASIAQTRALAEQANAGPRFDAVIHNAGIGYREGRRVETEDGLSEVFAVNVLAPYLLTALVPAASLVYLSSGMHQRAVPDMDDLQWERRRWNGSGAYSESKFLDVALAFAVARRWPTVRSNAVEPGWVATKMGGPGAPDDLRLGGDTQAWLAVGEDPRTQVSGGYFYHRQKREPDRATTDPDLQDALLGICEKLTGVSLPPSP